MRYPFAFLFPLALAPAQAAPITYNLDFHVETLLGPGGSSGYFLEFHPVPVIGDLYHGFFTVDDAVLSHDGARDDVAPTEFHVEMAGVVWDMHASIGHSFTNAYGFEHTPVFLIEGGSITGVLGGMHSVDDVPFVDFFPDGRFNARDIGPIGIQGSMSVTEAGAPGTPAVPEPATAGLSLLGFLAVLALGSRALGAVRLPT